MVKAVLSKILSRHSFSLAGLPLGWGRGVFNSYEGDPCGLNAGFPDVGFLPLGVTAL
jgi:hypothetical protein